MVSVIIPVLNGATRLAATLAAVKADANEVVVVDGGSTDGSQSIAAAAGARVLSAPRGRGTQLAAGANAAEGDWLLFLHADTVLDRDWRASAEMLIASDDGAERAGYFRLRFDDHSAPARRVAAIANWRSRRFGLPYGDQGLLISKSFYSALGGYRLLPLMEDVDLARRIGRRRLIGLPAAATTSAERYRRSGWVCRPARNLLCLTAYLAGMPPSRIARFYG